jgi:hypothetical protein
MLAQPSLCKLAAHVSTVGSVDDDMAVKWIQERAVWGDSCPSKEKHSSKFCLKMHEKMFEYN